MVCVFNSVISCGTAALPVGNSGIEYRVDPREVKARMDTPTVRAVLGMGYARDLVKQAIDQRLRTQGKCASYRTCIIWFSC